MIDLDLIPKDVLDKTARIDDKSDRFMSRLRIAFLNKYELSVIRGAGTYGGSIGLFEIAVFFDGKHVWINGGKDGEFVGSDVVGWQTKEDVHQWLIYVANLPEPPEGRIGDI